MAFDQNQQVFSICSGTLISPQRVLTAAHCIDDTVNAAGFGVYFGSDATLEDDPGFIFFTEATQVVFHPAWNPNDLAAGSDIGLVFLAQPAPITPIPIRTAPLGSAEIGAPVKLVGWGITGAGLEDSGRKRSTISELHDFDANLMQVGDANTGTCSGDSGGPAFMNVGGQIQVAGVTSFGDTSCADFSVDTRVDAFVTFITSDGQDVGNGGGAGGDFGAACSSSEECSSGLLHRVRRWKRLFAPSSATAALAVAPTVSSASRQSLGSTLASPAAAVKTTIQPACRPLATTAAARSRATAAALRSCSWHSSFSLWRFAVAAGRFLLAEKHLRQAGLHLATHVDVVFDDRVEHMSRRVRADVVRLGDG